MSPHAIGSRPAGIALGLRGERGFSLPELLAAIVVLSLMMAALFTTLDVSQQTFSRATAAEDAQVAARAVLERMASEFRMIGSFYFGAANAGYPITALTSSSITFRGDVNGDASTWLSSPSGTDTVTVASAAGFSRDELVYLARGAMREVATITSDPAGSPTLTLGTTLLNSYPATTTIARSVEQVTWSYDPAAKTITRTDAESGAVQMMDNVVAFNLTAYDVTGATTTTLTAIDSIEISVTTEARGMSRRTMQIRVQLRSMRVG